jgi:hypothetical protein
VSIEFWPRILSLVGFAFDVNSGDFGDKGGETIEGKHSRDRRGDDRIDPESEIEEKGPSGYNNVKRLASFQ